MSQTALQEALLESATLNKAWRRWKWTLTFVSDHLEGFRKEHGRSPARTPAAGRPRTGTPSCVPPLPSHIPGTETSPHLPTHRARRAPRGPNIGLLGCTSLSRTHEPVATGSRWSPQKQRPPLAVEGRRAVRVMSARGAHRSTTALGPRPGVFSLRPVAATPEPRTESGSCSSRLEESGPLAAGQAGACGEGL